MTYLLALDQGTTSSRSIVFDSNGQIVGSAQQELTQIYPRPGWVEHDPMEIWSSQLVTARGALSRAGLGATDIRAIGITNQRETTLLWNRKTGQPLCNAIVWQDHRSEPQCEMLRQQGMAQEIVERTGLRIDAYFSATKLQWMLENVEGARRLANKGELAFGTVDTWLMWQLTGGRLHATDATNAARTMLFNVKTGQWDDTLLRALDIPASILPTVYPSSHEYGLTEKDLLGASLPLCGVAGDQQSALFGQACNRPGMAKNTYGTGCFALMHTGKQFQISENGLITTLAAGINSEPQYALEGSVFVGGAVVQWLRDGLKAVEHSSQIQTLAESVPDSGGVMVVPAFTGMGAPYWQPDARGSITGLTRGTTLAHIARAALESIAYQSTALLQAMSRDAQASGGDALTQLRVDGGASVNDLLMQFQADLLGIPVLRSKVVETTALGAAWLAGLASDVWNSPQQFEALWQADKTFNPRLSACEAQARMEAWEYAVRQTCLPRGESLSG